MTNGTTPLYLAKVETEQPQARPGTGADRASAAGGFGGQAAREGAKAIRLTN